VIGLVAAWHCLVASLVQADYDTPSSTPSWAPLRRPYDIEELCEAG
jgi:hypothetical protein